VIEENVMTKRILPIAVTFGLALGALGAARPALAAPPPPYQSPMRGQCEAELARDKGWQAELRASVRPDVHEEDAAIMLRNKKHVVMAYGALWILTVGFLVLLWLRQRRLTAEIDRLDAKLAKAAEE
jgi:hypothetical protein